MAASTCCVLAAQNGGDLVAQFGLPTLSPLVHPVQLGPLACRTCRPGRDDW